MITEEATERQIQDQLKQIKLRKIEMLNNEGLRFWKPHSAQIAFERSLAAIRGFFAGNQAGKTMAGSVEMANIVGKTHQYRPNLIGRIMGRDCCIDFGHVVNVLVPTYQQLLPREPCLLPGLTFEGKERQWPGLKGGSWEKAYDQQDKILTFGDNSFIEFKSYDQGWQRFQGAKRHVIREDEEPQRKIHDENMARQATLGINMIITMTPLQYSQWLYAAIFEAAVGDDDIDVFKMSGWDNPYIDKVALQKLEDSIADPAERAARIYGDFTFLAGRVYKGYGDHNVVEPFKIPQHWARSFCIDPHPEKPTAVNWFAESPEGKTYVYREADISGDLKQICHEISSMSGGEYIDAMYIDPAAAEQRNKLDGRGRLIDEFHKFFPGLIKANNNRELGWDAVKQAVKNNPGGPKLYVFRSCPITDHQMRNYSWKPPTASGEDRRKPEVVKRNDDHCDIIRYRLMAGGTAYNKQFKGFDIRVYGA